MGTAHTLGASDVDAVWWDGTDKADTLTTTSDAQRMPDKGRLQCVVQATKNQNLIAYENHSQDCRVKETGDVSPTLTCMSNVNHTLVQEVGQTVFSKTGRPTEAGGCPNFKETGVANTLNLWDRGESRANELVVVKPPVISLDGDKMGKAERAGGSGLGVNGDDVMYTLTAKDVHGVAYGINCQASLMHPFSEEVSQVISVAHQSGVVRDECIPIDMRNATRDADKMDDMNRQGVGIGRPDDPLPTITAHHPHAVSIIRKAVACQKHPTVRRITPVEAERLMGFPDNWTRIPWRGKPAEQCPDGPRYKACGNSMCVNCMEWIGERIEKVERGLQEG